MRILKMRSWVILSGVLLCFAYPLKGESPIIIADTLKQLNEMPVKIPIPGASEYARYCAFCHGNEGKGDGLNAFSIKTRPRDFTDSVAMRGKTRVHIRTVIRTGGAANKLSADMPPWGKTLDSVTIERLVNYVWAAAWGTKSLPQE